MASSLTLSNPFSALPFRTIRRTQPLWPTSIPNLQKPLKFSKPTSNFVPFSRKICARTSTKDADTSVGKEAVVGEDSAAFELGKQKLSSWIYFGLILGVVLYVLDVAWIDNSTGFGKFFIQAVSSLSESHEAVMLILIFIFATVHSGLASFRDVGEELIGERAYRVLFAGVSLPLAISTVVYFINHRYDGLQLWQLQSVPLVHQMMVGQVIWCLAHTIWIGNSVAVAASLGLIGHHLFGVWNGDRRLAKRHGEAFEVVKRRTSIVPFAAIFNGRQKLPRDCYKEFLRLPYLSITALTLGAYFAHPLMQVASFQLHW